MQHERDSVTMIVKGVFQSLVFFYLFFLFFLRHIYLLGLIHHLTKEDFINTINGNPLILLFGDTIPDILLWPTSTTSNGLNSHMLLTTKFAVLHILLTYLKLPSTSFLLCWPFSIVHAYISSRIPFLEESFKMHHLHFLR